jgi:hypothetical protein
MATKKDNWIWRSVVSALMLGTLGAFGWLFVSATEIPETYVTKDEFNQHEIINKEDVDDMEKKIDHNQEVLEQKLDKIQEILINMK